MSVAELISRARPALRGFGRFFGGSLVGLVIDLGGFQLLARLGLDPGVANLLSSSAAVVVVYLLVSRYAFGARRSPWTFAAFCGWYAANIAVTSLAIHAAVAWFAGPPLVWKLCSVPLSFGANYVFGRVLFRAGRGDAASGAGRSRVVGRQAPARAEA